MTRSGKAEPVPVSTDMFCDVMTNLCDAALLPGTYCGLNEYVTGLSLGQR